MPFAPLLISGSPENYNLLITYEYSFQGKPGDGLFLANVQGDKVNWKKVEGVKGGLYCRRRVATGNAWQKYILSHRHSRGYKPGE